MLPKMLIGKLILLMLIICVYYLVRRRLPERRYYRNRVLHILCWVAQVRRKFSYCWCNFTPNHEWKFYYAALIGHATWLTAQGQAGHLEIVMQEIRLGHLDWRTGGCDIIYSIDIFISTLDHATLTVYSDCSRPRFCDFFPIKMLLVAFPDYGRDVCVAVYLVY